MPKNSHVTGSPIANPKRVNAEGHDELGLPVPPDDMTDDEFGATRPDETKVAAEVRTRRPPKKSRR